MTTTQVAICICILGFSHFVQAEIPKADAKTQVSAHESARMANSVGYQFTYQYALLKTSFDATSVGAWNKKQASGTVLLGVERTRYIASIQRLSEYGTNTGKLLPFGSYLEYSNDGDIFKKGRKTFQG